MEQDDFLRMEDEAAQRWEDSIVHECPNCDAQMISMASTSFGNYKHCPKCKKNYTPKNQSYGYEFQEMSKV
jgi:ssDNA-binding Zn-finger/Zn-ribbon topoisomerase 1